MRCANANASGISARGCPPQSRPLVEEFHASPEARYSALESASAAFLLALEALDPKQRAVLILRDVLGLSGPETAAILALSSANVRVILHRARKALESYDAERRPLSEARRQQARALLRRFMAAFSTGNFDGVRELLAEDCQTITDAGGEFRAAVRVIHGPDASIELYKNLARATPKPIWVEEQDHNGLPALALVLPAASPRDASRLVVQLDVDEFGRVTRIASVLASQKLTAVRFGNVSAVSG